MPLIQRDKHLFLKMQLPPKELCDKKATSASVALRFSNISSAETIKILN